MTPSTSRRTLRVAATASTLEVARLQEQERPDTEEREDLARSVLEGPGMEAPRDEVAGKVEEGKAAAGGRLDDLDEVEQAAREAEQES